MQDVLLKILQEMMNDTQYSDDYLNDMPGHWVNAMSSTTRNDQSFSYDESYHNDIRNICRSLYLNNPFAINAIENRINFTIGKGHMYHAIPTDEDFVSLAKETQKLIDDFVLENQWVKRQQEIMRRLDRDGEVFIRFFYNDKEGFVFRFIEPELVATPNSIAKNYSTNLGIKTSTNDIETVEGYWIDSEFVTKEKIQHRKCNVDINTKRGISILYAVRRNLIRADKLLRNMSVVAEIQSAIALIRKHSAGNADSIQKYLQSTSLRSNNYSSYHQKFMPGTIIDAQSGIDYEFPIATVDASRYIQILQAELRAIAARLIMPEFMLTSDASNANYSSSLVAEGPAVRMFERLQTDMIREDIKIFHKFIQYQIEIGKLPENTLKCISLQAIPPTLAVRDRYNEAKADEILLKNGIISPQTMAMRYGLNPEKETWLHFHRDDCSCENIK